MFVAFGKPIKRSLMEVPVTVDFSVKIWVHRHRFLKERWKPVLCVRRRRALCFFIFDTLFVFLIRWRPKKCSCCFCSTLSGFNCTGRPGGWGMFRMSFPVNILYILEENKFLWGNIHLILPLLIKVTHNMWSLVTLKDLHLKNVCFMHMDACKSTEFNVCGVLRWMIDGLSKRGRMDEEQLEKESIALLNLLQAPQQLCTSGFSTINSGEY